MPRLKFQAPTDGWEKRATEPGSYSDGYGLTLRIDARGNKRWVQRLTIGGRQRNMGLGSWPSVSLDKAREMALANWREAKEGQDPIREKRIARVNAEMPSLPTFEDVARRVIALRRPTWSSEKHADQWESSLATHMKARREHRVPLSGRALALLEEARSLGTGTGLVFPSRKGKPLSNMAFTMLLRRLEAGDAVPHGFRSTFKDWTLEQTTFSWAVVETALAHTLGSATESAYARIDLFDRRRELMKTWATHCESAKAASPRRLHFQEPLLPERPHLRRSSLWESVFWRRSGWPAAQRAGTSKPLQPC